MFQALKEPLGAGSTCLSFTYDAVAIMDSLRETKELKEVDSGHSLFQELSVFNRRTSKISTAGCWQMPSVLEWNVLRKRPVACVGT